MGTDIEAILEKLLSRREKITPEEEYILDDWMKEAGNRKKFYELQRIKSAIYAVGASEKVDSEESWQRVSQRINQHRRRLRFLPYAAAVVIIFGLGVSIRLLTGPRDISSTIVEQTETGRKQVILTLSTGQEIALTDGLSPMVETNGTTIRNGNNQLVYNPTDTAVVSIYNTITVPRGGEYKLVLADNTIVWLNSGSRLTYPVAFKGNTRELNLEGEAFFEVTKDKHKPFIVHTSQFDIRVTGTQFNIRTYPEETESATLAEGSIQLEKDHRVYRLVPGQQAYLNGEEVKIKEVNPEDAIAWRYNAFSFKEVPLEHIMNELARWYDINVFYQSPEIKELHFTAWFQRSIPIQELLKILEKTQQVKLELKGRTLIVEKKQ